MVGTPGCMVIPFTGFAVVTDGCITVGNSLGCTGGVGWSEIPVIGMVVGSGFCDVGSKDTNGELEETG
jgi:hypothetical protein